MEGKKEQESWRKNKWKKGGIEEIRKEIWEEEKTKINKEEKKGSNKETAKGSKETKMKRTKIGTNESQGGMKRKMAWKLERKV